ncbi:Plastid-lipid associated protein PAP / fibrillin family protein [Hibiscus syriacus]|uniref:Plastid-lipid associated protein PAP / fibrillin family protein n=1 Tax=Hibiscus syriacus TaxID=106335 RepID=A0A6A3D0L8_HIBSY|nr:Plastid-lipid associated protein PAP / fibrillin family protein [Hibiscus syriacus]
MFGCSNQPGIVYRSLKDILGDLEEDDNGGERSGIGTSVRVTVLEIYNEEIYDLLSSNGGGGIGFGWSKGNGSKVKLEVMGKKAKNATFISGSEAGKISKEIQKVEKRRIVKSTLCNERSSRSHCMIILDVPTVGGRLMLVDMAGSENTDNAGQVGFETKMQTAKINQGNIGLKRVVESIANGDSHVPFRDSKLTMLLQDSFEDDQSKILMILCATPDPKEIHKTICTLEYGAKAKWRASREREKEEAHKALVKKEEEVEALRSLLEVKGSGSGATEDEINLKVNEQTQMLKLELEKKLDECKRMAEEFIEMERRRMEERILQQQEEVEMLRKRLQEIELELCSSRDRNGDSRDHNGDENESSNEMDGSGFAKRLVGIYGDEVPGMVMSMELDMNDPEPFIHDVKHVDKNKSETNLNHRGAANHDGFTPVFGAKLGLTTVYEEEEIAEEDEEVEKVIIEEKRICSNEKDFGSAPKQPDSDTSRLLRIQNIFTLCGNQRELSQIFRTPTPAKVAITETIDPHWSSVMFITIVKVTKDATLADLRKFIDIYLDVDNQAFTFLVLGDPNGMTVPKENEVIVKASKLPICNNGYLACLRPAKGLQITNHLPLSPLQLTPLPLTPLENKLPLTASTRLSNQGDDLLPQLGTTPFITGQRRM